MTLVTLSARAAAQDDTAKAAPPSPKPASAASVAGRPGGEALEAMHRYKASLEKLVKIYDAEFKKKVARVQERQELYEKGYISRLELEESRRELAGIEGRLRETEQKIAEVEIGIAEAAALDRMRRLPPLAFGEYREQGAMIRYGGKGRWSLAALSRIQKAFSARFGRPLPVSALGQTAFHEQMRFDHREAADVALHPDSFEGKWLMSHLRDTGIPFIAFRNGVPRAATGAHIHIGPASARRFRGPGDSK